MAAPMKACERCEQPFRPQRSTARFCSAICRKDAWLAQGGGAGAQNAKGAPTQGAGTLSVEPTSELAPALSPPASVLYRDAHGFLHRTPSQRRVKVPAR
jgi:hypothetical protein